MSDAPEHRPGVATPGYPIVEWLERYKLARWTFATADRSTQEREFEHWRGWFGFDEDDQPDRVEGKVWFVRRKRAWS